MKKKITKLSGKRLYTLKRQLAAELTLREVQRILQQEGIKVVTLKGPYLGHTIYHDPLNRNYCDLDLLVKVQEFKRAFELLSSNGFVPAESAFGRSATAQSFYNKAFYSPIGIRVELHRELSGYGRYRVDLNEMINRAVPFRMGKVHGFGFCPEDLLLHLCIHILKSYFIIDNKHLTDIALLVEARSIDWVTFLNRVRRAGCAVGTWYILEASKRQHGAKIPDNVLSALKPRGLRRLWLDKTLNLGAFPMYKYHKKNMLEAQIILGLPLIDRIRDWYPLLLRYTIVRLKDMAANLPLIAKCPVGLVLPENRSSGPEESSE